MPLILDTICDSEELAQVLEALIALGIRGAVHRFGKPDYGDDVLKIVIVFNCTRWSGSLKQRIRLEGKSKTLYMDIMLDYQEMLAGDMAVRMRLILDALDKEVPRIVLKYRSNGFDAMGFLMDFKQWIDSMRPLLHGPVPPQPLEENDAWLAELAVSVPVKIITTPITAKYLLSETSETLLALGLTGRAKFFPRTEYGSSISVIQVGFHCSPIAPPRYQYFFPTMKILGVHVLLDYDAMVAGDLAKRKKIVLDALEIALLKAVSRRKLPGFDKDRFGADVRSWISQLREK